MKKKRSLTPAGLALLYAGLGAIWIAFSDRVVDSLVTDRGFKLTLNTGKGWVYVLVTAFLLWGLVRDMLKTNLELKEQNLAKDLSLRETETLYRTLVETLPDAVILTDAASTLTFVSQKTSAMFGDWDNSHMIDTCAFDWMVAEDRERTIVTFSDLINGRGKAQVNMYHMRRVDGSVFVCEICSSALLNSDGKPKGMVSILRDATMREQGRAKLKDSEEKLRSLFENLSEGILLHQLLRNTNGNVVDSHIIDANPAAERITGLLKFDFVNTTLGGLTKKIPLPFAEVFSEVVLKKEPFSGEIWVAQLNKHLEVSVTPWGKDGVATIFSDITQRKLYETRMKESEERWLFALEGSDDGVWDWDISNGRVFFSQRWKSMLDFGSEEISDNPDEWWSRIHPEDVSAARRNLDRHLHQETSFYLSEYRMRCRDGNWKWIRSRGRVMRRDAEGNAVRVVGTHSDIEDQHRSAEIIKSLARFAEEDPNPILRTDGDGRILYTNAASRQMTDLWNNPLNDCLPVELRDDLRAILRQGQTQSLEYTWNERKWRILMIPIPADGFVDIFAESLS